VRDLVSVIIPAFNAANFLDNALRSVLAQAWPTETLVVNDGSTDHVHEVLRPYAGRVTFIDQKNRGLSAARNEGLRRATGRFVLFLDADDMLGANVVAGQVQALETGGGVGVPVCRSRFFSSIDSGGAPEPCGRWRRFPHRLDIHLCHFNVAPIHAFLVRRDIAMEAGGFDEGLGACEDHDFWLRVQGIGHAPYPGAEAVVWYRRHAGSMSANLERQWRHDLEMHLRVARLVVAGAPGFADDRGVRLLACCAAMLLTAIRLSLPLAEPLLPWLLRLPGLSAEAPANNDELYAYFLARCLMLCATAQADASFSDIAAAVRQELAVRAVEAGLDAWLKLNAPELAEMTAAMAEALYDGKDP